MGQESVQVAKVGAIQAIVVAIIAAIAGVTGSAGIRWWDQGRELAAKQKSLDDMKTQFESERAEWQRKIAEATVRNTAVSVLKIGRTGLTQRACFDQAVAALEEIAPLQPGTGATSQLSTTLGLGSRFDRNGMSIRLACGSPQGLAIVVVAAPVARQDATKIDAVGDRILAQVASP